MISSMEVLTVSSHPMYSQKISDQRSSSISVESQSAEDIRDALSAVTFATAWLSGVAAYIGLDWFPASSQLRLTNEVLLEISTTAKSLSTRTLRSVPSLTRSSRCILLKERKAARMPLKDPSLGHLLHKLAFCQTNHARHAFQGYILASCSPSNHILTSHAQMITTKVLSLWMQICRWQFSYDFYIRNATL